MKRPTSSEIVKVFSMGLKMPARKINAKTSDIVTEASMICPAVVLSRLYCQIRTETMESEGTAIVKARTKVSEVPKGKRSNAISAIKSKGIKKLVIESKEATRSRPCIICVFISKPMWNIMKNKAIDETALRGSSATTKPRMEGPIIIPLSISPTTAGRRTRSKSSPK